LVVKNKSNKVLLLYINQNLAY